MTTEGPCVTCAGPGLRRARLRDLERAGVAPSVAMNVTGHKTESVYRRYAIVSERDIAEGLAKVAALRPVAVPWAPCCNPETKPALPRRCLPPNCRVGWWPGTELNRRHADFQNGRTTTPSVGICANPHG